MFFFFFFILRCQCEHARKADFIIMIQRDISTVPKKSNLFFAVIRVLANLPN